MKNILLIAQIIITALMITLILLQAKGVGLGKTWGGAGEFYKSRRGVEKIIFQFTIILALFFFLFSVLNLIFNS